jgi:signal peptide peptidase SppA
MMPNEISTARLMGALAFPWAIEPNYFRSILEYVRDPGSEALHGFLPESPVDLESAGGVAVVPVKGPLHAGTGGLFEMLFGGTGYQRIIADLQDAAADDGISQIVLDIDSPGGSIAGLWDVVSTIQAIDKPVIAYTGGTMASAAYWIGSAADRIVASPQGVVGSIGAVLSITDYSKLDEKTGIEEIEIVSSQSPHKRPNPKTEEGRTTLQEHIDNLAQVFIESVADNRGVSAEFVQENYGKGGVLVGKHALSAGMIDSISGINDLLAAGGITMPGKTQDPVIDRAFIETHHRDIVDAIYAEGVQAGRDAGIAEGVAAERERIQAVMALEGVDGKEEAALKMALQGLSIEQAQAILGAVPKATDRRVTPLSAEMAAIENPDVGPDVALSEEDMFIRSIVEAGRAAGVKFAQEA